MINAQNTDSLIVDSVANNILAEESLLALDSNLILNDSIPNDTIPLSDTLVNIDSLQKDSVIVVENNNMIEDPIDFSARDSMYISVSDKTIILFGEGKLITVGLELQADSIGLDMQKKELKAVGVMDSLGRYHGQPVFIEQDKEYDAARMRYNFDTKKGIVYDVRTQEQEGYLHGKYVKIHSTNEMHIKDGKYTTCDHPNPHYYIDLTKAKLKSKDKIITGPFYFVIQGIPVPIAAPFGFFPLSRKNTSGIKFPTYKDEIDLGFGLVGGGYYWAINDYVDLDITGDAYSKGSWGVHLISNFKKRYKFSGNANLNFFHKKTGPKELVTTQIGNTYSIQLSFQQDPKARPNSNFSTSINYVYGDYRKFNSNDINDFVNTTTTSSFAYQKTFAGTGFRMSASMNMSQNLQDSTTNLKFPTINFSSSQIYLFKPKNKPAKGAWYEKINLSFTSSLSNSVYTHDTILRNVKHIDSTFRAMKSGFKYSVPVKTSMKVFKQINITPSFNFTGRIYPYRIEQNAHQTDYETTIQNDTIWGFNHVYDFNTGVSMSTRLYSMLSFKKGKLKAIRHVMSPSISYNYKPDFAEEQWGYYEQKPLDSTATYSYYDGSLFGSAPAGEQQTINFSLGNNIEAKVVSRDTAKGKDKKVKLLDNLSFSQSYNFAADSLNLSNLGINASVKPTNKTSVSFSTQIDPYAINTQGKRINKLELLENNNIGRLTSANLTIGAQLSSQDLKKGSKNNSGIKWAANIDYSFRYSKTFNVDDQEYDINLTQNATLNFNITPTPMWEVSIRTGYDFNQSKITSTTLNLHRNLHCWEMSLQVTPFGQMKSYLFKINVKSSMFEALQIKRERSWHDNF